MKNNYFNRNHFMMTSLDEMISKDSKVCVIDAYVSKNNNKKKNYSEKSLSKKAKKFSAK